LRPFSNLPDPEQACAEACRVFKPGGKFDFTVWAPPAENPYAKMVDDAIQGHADLENRSSNWTAASFVFWSRRISPDPRTRRIQWRINDF
jgi:ubiquinone/menaquinone biosynthesis C-methylase UbiE